MSKMSYSDKANELRDSFVNGNITAVMEELNQVRRFDAMFLVILIQERLNEDERESFRRAVIRRTSSLFRE